MEKSQTNAINVTMHPLIVSALRRHLIKHSGEKPNKCNQCDYASSQTGHLKMHLKTHTGEKSNKCSLCKYASSRAGNLRTHLKTHSGEKWNKCNCDYATSKACHLRDIWTHTVNKSKNKATNVNLIATDYASFWTTHLRTYLEIHSL